MSNPGTPPMPRPEALKKLAQLRIERLKKEEEEEQWISGEELYTEGSSDEEDTALRTKRKANERGCKKSRNVGSKVKKPTKEEHQKIILPQVNLTSCTEKNEVEEVILVDAGDAIDKGAISTCCELDSQVLKGDPSSTLSEDEFQEEISWRPKREIENADQAYCNVIERVKKLKHFVNSECMFHSSSEDEGESCCSYKKTENEKLQPIFTCDWDFLQKSCDAESALSNIKILDTLLEIIDCKQKEVHNTTLNVQLQMRNELSQLLSEESTNDEVTNNIKKFLHLCVFNENEDNLKDTKNGAVCKGDQLSKNQHNQNNTSQLFLIPQSLDTLMLTKDKDQSLHLTDDDKQRLASLLDETEPFVDEFSFKSVSSCKSKCEIKKCDDKRNDSAFPFHQETKLSLDEINEKLKAFSKTQLEKETFQQLRNQPYPMYEYNENEEDAFHKDDIEQQLQRINILLESLRSNEDTQHLTDEQIKELVKMSMESLEDVSQSSEDIEKLAVLYSPDNENKCLSDTANQSST